MALSDEDINKAIDTAGIQAADANFDAAQGVQPAAAAAAIVQQPRTGIPPNLGMVDPTVGNGMVDRSNRQAILSSAVGIQGYASQSPAHAASIADDLQGLHGVVQALPNLSPFDLGDLLAPARSAQTEVRAGEHEVAAGQTFRGLYHQAEGSALLGFSPFFAPFTFLTGRTSRGLGAIAPPPGNLSAGGGAAPAGFGVQLRILKGLFGVPQDKITSLPPEQAAAFWQNLLMMGIGAPETKAGTELELVREAGEAPRVAPTGGDPIPRPGGGFHTDPEGNLVNAEGAPAQFSSPKAAAQWIIRRGYQYEHGQILEPTALNDQGLFGVKATEITPEVRAAAETNIAEQNAQAVSDLQAAAAQTETIKRAPSILADIINREAPGTEVTIPGNALSEIANAPTFGLSPAELDVAAAGGNVTVPLGDYIAATAEHPQAKAINDITRFEENGQSVAEAKDLAEQARPAEVQAPMEGAPTQPEGPDLTPAPNAAELQATDAYKKALESYQAAGITKADAAFDINMLSADVKDGVEQMHNLHETLQAVKDYYTQLEASGPHSPDKAFTWTGGEVDKDFEDVLQGHQDLVQAPGWEQLQRILKTQAAQLKAATRKAITQAYLRPLFTDPKAVGMSQKEFGLYSKQIEEAHRALYKKLLEKAIQRVKRNRTRIWREAYHRNYSQVVNEIMATPGIRAYHILKYAVKDDLVLGNAFVKNGKPIDFYHGSSHTNIEKWEAKNQPVISFSTDPKFASRWAGEREGSMVYIVHLKAKAPADFRKPEDIKKAAEWFAKDAGEIPGTEGFKYRVQSYYYQLQEGSWSLWETPRMWKDLGWDAAHMKESPGSTSVNACVVDGNQVYFKYRISEQLGQIKLSNVVKASLTKEVLAGLPTGIFDKDGVSLDAFAEAVEGNSADVLNALTEIETRRKAEGLTFKQWLKKSFEEETTRRTENETGLILDLNDIEAEARDSIVAPAAEDVLTTELEALAKTQALPFDRETIKLDAQRMYGNLPVAKAIKIRPFEEALRNLGREAEVALLKKDPAKAFKAKLNQLQNYYMLQEAHTLVKMFGKLDKKLARFARRKTVKGIDQRYMNHIHELLPQLGYPIKRNEIELAEALNGVSTRDFVSRIQGTRPGFPGLPQVPKGPITGLSVNQFWDLRNFLQSFEKVGREVNQVVLADKVSDFEDLVSDAIAGAPPRKGPPRIYRSGGRRTAPEKATSFAKGFFAAHYKMPTIAEYLDSGNIHGVFHQFLEQMPESSADTQSRLHRDVQDVMKEVYNRIPKVVRKTYPQKITNHPFMGPDGNPIEIIRGDLPAIAKHTGTVANLEKLAEGYMTILPEVMQFLDQHMTKEEWDFVQAYWDGFAKLSKELSPILRRETGTGLEAIPPRPVVTAHGTYRGGYAPVRYDSTLSPQIDELEREREQQFAGDAMSKMFYTIVPSKGFAVKRTSFVAPISLKLSDMIADYNEHIKYIAWATTARQVRTFFNDQRIAALVKDRMGEEFYNQIHPWLDDLIVDWTVPQSKALSKVEWVARQLNVNSSMAILAFSYTTMLGQVPGWLASAALLGEGKPGMGTKWMSLGVGKFVKTLMAGTLEEDMFSKSEFMKQRHSQVENNLVIELNRQENQLGDTLNNYDKMRHLGMMAIGWVEFTTVSGPTWFGAYAKALSETSMTELQARRFADKIVRDSQGSGRTTNTAAVQRGSHFMRFWYRFSSWYNTSFQLMVKNGRHFQRGEYGKGFLWLFGIFITSPLLSALISNDGPDDLEPMTMARWALQKEFANLTRPVIFLGTATNALDRAVHAKHGKYKVARAADIDFSNDPVTATLEADAKFAALATGARDRKPVQTTTRALGLSLGVPGSIQAGRSGQYLYDALITHREHPRNLADWLKGLSSGPTRRPS